MKLSPRTGSSWRRPDRPEALERGRPGEARQGVFQEDVGRGQGRGVFDLCVYPAVLGGSCGVQNLVTRVDFAAPWHVGS